MVLMRPFVLFTMMHNIWFKTLHIEGAKNEIADALSRFQMKRFHQLAPNAQKNPEDIPIEFMYILWKQKLTA